jgi:hypothetical protein
MSDGEITEVSLTIRVLRVGKGQMTKAILRQLVPERMVDEVNVELLGTPLGWVNLRFPASNPKARPARQFLVQFGNRPGRCPFVIRNLTESPSEWSQEWRKPVLRFLASQGVATGETWEFLIEKNAEAVRDYIARWNALMDRLRSVEQLFI